MSVRARLEGINEFRQALRDLPEAITKKASKVVVEAARSTQRDVTSAYPAGKTGNLKAGVSSRATRSRKFSAEAQVRSRAPHAHIFEKGSAPRKTGDGYNRGSMPKAPDSQRFIPVAIRARREMTRRLVELVEAEGFEVVL